MQKRIKSVNKQEKQKMKVLELSSKVDYQYYLYQLICRTYKKIKQQDLYLERFSEYIEKTARACVTDGIKDYCFL